MIPNVPEVSPKQVKQKIDRKEDFILLDVREQEEVELCRIEGSVHIPLSCFQSKFSELPKDKEIIVHCHSGMRSVMATQYLIQKGFRNVKTMQGGIDLWSVEVDPKVPRYTP